MLRVRYLYVYLFLLYIFTISCSKKKDKELSEQSNIQVITNDFPVFQINPDSLSSNTPGENGIPLQKIIKSGIPTKVAANSNFFPEDIPKLILTGSPFRCTPGQDTFFLPKTTKITQGPHKAGIPEVVLAKEPYMRDQNPLNFNSFGKLQGLKHNVVRHMMQDKRGNLWFGTYGGVSKFDGKYFTHFTMKEGLTNNNVVSMIEDSHNNLWFGTEGGGISKYDGKTFTSFTEREGLANNNVKSILEDRNGHIWFGTSEGVSKDDGKTFTNFTRKEGLTNNNVRSIIQAYKGNLWFGTEGGLSQYKGENLYTFY